MEENNINSYSLIPITSSSLVRLMNSFDITNKILNERNPNLKISLLKKAIELINQKKFKEAISVLNEIIFIDFLNPLAYFQRGLAYYELKKYDNAINDFSKVISIEPENASAYTKLAKVILYGNWAGKIKFTDSTSFWGNTKLEYYQTAIQYCDKAINLEPNLREAYFIRGMCNYYSSENKEAVKDFDKAIELDPNLRDTYIQRGFAKMYCKDYVGVLLDENKLKEFNPKFSFKNYGYPDIKSTINLLEQYSNSININPLDSDAYRNRGVTKFNALDYDGAIEDISKAIDINPNDSFAYYCRAIIKTNPNCEDYETALLDYNIAIEIKPDDSNYYLQRGKLKFSLKDYQGVIDDCTYAISIDITLADAYINRGWAKSNLFGTKYEDNSDIKKYEELTGKDMSDPFSLI